MSDAPPTGAEWTEAIVKALHLGYLDALDDVQDQHRHRCSGCDWCYSDGVREALNAAREAVAALPEYRMRDTCIAAIEKLGEEKP